MVKIRKKCHTFDPVTDIMGILLATSLSHCDVRRSVAIPGREFCMTKMVGMIRGIAYKTMFALATVLSCAGISAQDKGYDVFNPIAKYIAAGDADKLSAWFSDNLEVTIFSSSNDSSRSQARQIMRSFFKSYTPRSFDISHKAGRSNMKYALGTLNAGGEMFLVTLFVSLKDNSYKIQQIKIERL